MNITQLPLNDLKALAFDEGEQLKITQNNINLIYAELNRRLQEKPENPSNKASKNDNDSKN